MTFIIVFQKEIAPDSVKKHVTVSGSVRPLRLHRLLTKRLFFSLYLCSREAIQ